MVISQSEGCILVEIQILVSDWSNYGATNCTTFLLWLTDVYGGVQDTKWKTSHGNIRVLQSQELLMIELVCWHDFSMIKG